MFQLKVLQITMQVCNIKGTMASMKVVYEFNECQDAKVCQAFATCSQC